MIGLGRLLLAILYLIAIAADTSQPARAPVATYALLVGFVAFAAITVALTWNDWWLDAKIAGAAHAIDIAFFTLLMLLTEGYTSPFFAFFVFVLLSAAIRWGWRSTALTSVLLILLYLVAGLIAAGSSTEIELQNFGVRTGHLLILSLILIWFGASRWGLHSRSGHRQLIGPPSPDQPPFETALRAIMSGLKARSGAFVWRAAGQNELSGQVICEGEASSVTLPARTFERATRTAPLLYDLAQAHCLTKDDRRNLIESNTADHFDPHAMARLGLSDGLAIPVRSADGEGEMFLEGVPGLSTDHIDLGEQIAADIAAHMQAHALLLAADERAEARSRLTLARDLHDGVVQFLAGAAFRLEAIRRSHGSGRDLAPEIEELKQLMLEEQDELRTFITALRAGPVAAFADLAADLRGLADHLARQWNVRCTLTAEPSDKTIPARLQLDARQLVREAVANAVRHADSRWIRIALAADDSELRLEIVNDGAPPRSPGGRIQVPKSLMERVEQAGGAFDISRGVDFTRVAIALPVVSRRS